MSKLKIGEIDIKKLVNYFGTEKQKEDYKKNKKLNNRVKESILKKASKFCDIQYLGQGKFKIYKVSNLDIDNDELIFPLLKGLSQYITPLILSKLLTEQDENYKITLSFISWAQKFQMVNGNYSLMRYHQEKSSKYLKIDENTLFDYFNKMDDCIKYYLEKILITLSNKSGLDLIEFDSITKVRKIIREQKNNGIEIKFKCKFLDEEISDKDRKFVIDCENKAKEKAGIINNKEKFFGAKAKLYKDKLSELLITRDILFTYQAYNIFCKSKKEIKKVLSKFESIIDYKNNNFIEEFNNIFMDYIENKAIKTSKREQEKLNKLLADCNTNSTEINYNKQFRLVEAYVKDFKVLSELTVPVNAKDLSNEIKITLAEKYHVNIEE
jgi:hypothetical protein